jgi:hypothetical protein
MAGEGQLNIVLLPIECPVMKELVG